MLTEAFFWFLLLGEVAAIVLLSVALLGKIRQIARDFADREGRTSEFH